MAVKGIDDVIWDIAHRYASTLMQVIKLDGMYVYGSHSKGIADCDSDVDIAVIPNDFTGNVVDDRLLLMRLRRKVDIRIEPHPFRPVDFVGANPLANEIMASGIPIVPLL